MSRPPARWRSSVMPPFAGQEQTAEGSVPSPLISPIEAPAPVSPFRLGAPADRAARDRFLINEVLNQNPNALAYFVSQELRERFPDRFILETTDVDFDPIRFAHEKQCRCEARPVPHPHLLFGWDRQKERVQRWLAQSWLDLYWNGLAFECLHVLFADGSHRRVYWALIAHEQEDAERFFQVVCAWNAELHHEILVYTGHSFEKDQEMYRAIKSATLADLVLAAGLRDEIVADVTRFFERHEVYERYGVPWKRGLLFIGPPGNGKTHAVKALVNHLGKRCIYVKRIISGYRHDSDDIAEIFARARSSAPCILVFEDLDAMLTDRNRSQFLNEMDGFARHAGVLTLATTNHPERLDAAILQRPSRFDRTYRFDLPDEGERRAWLEHWSDGAEADLRLSSEGIKSVVAGTAGFSFAYLKELCLASTMQWLELGARHVMDEVMVTQAALLRTQLTAAVDPEPVLAEEDE